MKIDTSSLPTALQALSKQATAGLKNNQPFQAFADDGNGGQEKLAGTFQYTIIEPAGNNALFVPGSNSTPNAGSQVFADALENFLTLAEASAQNSSGSSLPKHATYQTASNFTGDGVAMQWSGSFTLDNLAKS